MRVGMRQFIYKDQLRTPDQSGIQIKFPQFHPFIVDLQIRKRLQPLRQFHRVRTVMWLDISCYHIDAMCFRIMRRLQHCICFPASGSIAEKNF